MRATTRAPAQRNTPRPTDVDVMALDARRPQAGDHVTLFDLDEASPWLKMRPSTIREKLRLGLIPGRFVTRIGDGRRRRTYMSGDQIVGLLLHWRMQSAETETSPDPLPRRRPRKATKAKATTRKAAA